MIGVTHDLEVWLESSFFFVATWCCNRQLFYHGAVAEKKEKDESMASTAPHRSHQERLGSTGDVYKELRVTRCQHRRDGHRHRWLCDEPEVMELMRRATSTLC